MWCVGSYTSLDACCGAGLDVLGGGLQDAPMASLQSQLLAQLAGVGHPEPLGATAGFEVLYAVLNPDRHLADSCYGGQTVWSWMWQG